MSHSERIENALKEAKRKLNLNGLAIVCLRAIISKHIPEQNELREALKDLISDHRVQLEAPCHLLDKARRSLATPSEPLGVTKHLGVEPVPTISSTQGAIRPSSSSHEGEK